MPRSIAMLIIGITAFINGFYRLGTPAQEVEKSGWIFQHFGSPGVAYGTIALGAVCLVAGSIMFRGTWRRIRESRKYRK